MTAIDRLINTDRVGVAPGSGWMTPQEAAGYMGLSVAHVYRLCSTNKLAKSQASDSAAIWIRKDECDRYLRIQSN